MVPRPYRRRAAKRDRRCEWGKRTLAGCQGIEQPYSRIAWPLGRRWLRRPFRQPSRDAEATKPRDLRAEIFYTESAGCAGICRQIRSVARGTAIGKVSCTAMAF